ncbi:hypothetical protein RN001_003128 [Aquatica leii]|uniref:Fe2OG dioxygenase domain-containing protein n=1 Tax=Aquatica leii TaxID=1421715 RepID=A0AAN7PHV7_9COLE|nr:hypothetical protein RN001_003128 [Aquatica leii]
MFREDFNSYKSQNPPLSKVLNFNDCKHLLTKQVKEVKVKMNAKAKFGLKPSKDWKVYELNNNSGLIFIKNPFTVTGQRYWIIRSLRDYTNKPNKLNLDIHNIIPQNEEFWTFSQKDINVMNKLRWATLGYHHNWDTKVYSETSKSDFPLDLASLSQYVADVLNFSEFRAEAAIVNFYHMNSRLSGHTDHSEQFLEAPLFSFSFGQTAIFLIGGATIDTKPTALFIESGDIIVMSKESRLCYHGVPKILHAEVNLLTNDNEEINGEELNCDTLEDCNDSIYWTTFQKYINNCRININVRQVLRPINSILDS